jgi:hypothetical protein
MNRKLSRLAAALAILAAPSAWADDPFFFSTGNVTNAIGMASRPDVGGKTEIEAADDFVTTAPTTITSATFTGVVTSITGLSTIGEVVVEIYRVFPLDSNTVRTPNVPTRANSPSDVALDSRSSSVAGEMTFATATLATTFTASNSVLNGIHAFPNQLTMGEGAVTGREVQFTVTFTTPLVLPTDHYFFIPQVQVAGGEFYWLSGTDIVGGNPVPTFNGAFTLTGTVAAVPEPATSALMLLGLAAVGAVASRRQRVRAPSCPPC